jgi:hypothetical protein
MTSVQKKQGPSHDDPCYFIIIVKLISHWRLKNFQLNRIIYFLVSSIGVIVKWNSLLP